jgi:hypothetical protein
MEVELHVFLTSALDGREWLTWRPSRFTSAERTPDTHFIGGYLGSRTGLEAVAKRKNPCP